MPVFTNELEKTLRRALSEANQRRQEWATLEHLLLALTDDADARPVLEGCGCDVPRLQAVVRHYVETELENLISESNEEAKATDGFQRVVQRAAFSVQSAGKEEVTGANILVSIFAERENTPLDADQLFAVHSLMTAHAGLMVLFPDINDITTKFDRYKDLSSSALQATSGILDKALVALADAEDIFDEDTHNVLVSVSQLETVQQKGEETTKGVLATKHSWLRGTLAAIGNFIVEKFKETGEKLVRKTIDNVLEHPQRYLFPLLRSLQQLSQSSSA
jgi:hypothetical protein